MYTEEWNCCLLYTSLSEIKSREIPFHWGKVVCSLPQKGHIFSPFFILSPHVPQYISSFLIFPCHIPDIFFHFQDVYKRQAVGYAKRAVMMKLGSICSSCRFQDAPEAFRHKENRLRELQMEISRSGYAKHSHNLKILN